MDFSDFHKICFTKNYWKSYYDMDYRLKINVDSWKLFPQTFFLAKFVAHEKGALQYALKLNLLIKWLQ